MDPRLKELQKMFLSFKKSLPIPDVAQMLEQHPREIGSLNPDELIQALKKSQKELKVNLKKLKNLTQLGKPASDIESSDSDIEDSDEELGEEIQALFASVVMGDLAMCDRLLQRGVDVNCRDSKKSTPLHIAVCLDKLDMANLLFARGADTNAVNNDGNTPLMDAVMKNHQGFIGLLVDKGTDLSIKNKRGFTAADLAFMKEDLDTAKRLQNKQKALQFDTKVHKETILNLTTHGKEKMIEYWLSNYPKLGGMNPVDHRYKDGRTIAFAAALAGSMELIQLVDKHGGNFDIPDDTSSSPLFCAAQNGHEHITRFLLSKGCDVNRVRDTGRTPLFSAIQNNHFPIAKMLVENGAEIDVKDEEGTCPLACCIMAGNQDMFAYLLEERKADFRVVDNNGNNLAILAASYKQFGILKMLGKLDGLLLDYENNKTRETALLKACQTSSSDAVEYLIGKGCDINHVNNKGMTPALRAAFCGNVESVKLLASNGARLDEPNKFGETAILVAAQKKNTTLVEFLRGQGCNMAVIDDNGCSLASYAAGTSNTELLELLKKNSAPLEVQERNGNTPLIIAAMWPPNLEMVLKYLEFKCDHKTKNVKGDTALSIAAKQGSIDVAKRLIEAGADWLNITNKGKTIIMQTAKRGQVAVLKMIKDSKQTPDVNATDSSGRTAVHYAAIGGRLDALEFLVNEMKSDTEMTDNEKCTPFMLAVSKGHKSVAEKLLDLGADINLRNKIGENSSHLAVKAGNLEMLRYLGQKMCYLDQEDNQGISPLMLACRNKNLEMVNYLLSKKCSIESVTKDGRRIIHDACESGSFPVAMRVINLGIPLDSADCNGATTLMLAAQKGSEKTARALIDRKKELLHMRDASGKTALDYAIQSDRIKLVQLLIDAGCNVNNLMSDGGSSLLLAIEKCKKDDQKIVQLLLEHQARTDTVTQDGLNAAHLACKFNKLSTLKLLIEKGVQLDSLTKQGDSCLTLAMPEASAELIGLLIDSGLDKSHMNSEGHSAVSLACLREDEEILSKILPLSKKDTECSFARGNSLLHFAIEGQSSKLAEKFLNDGQILPDVKNNGMETPLHTACGKGNKELAELLLKHRADANAADEKGETPIFKALSIASEDIVQLLIDSGADLNAVSHDGVSVLAKAFYNGNRPIIKLLQSQPVSVQLFPEKLPESFDLFQANFRSMNFKNMDSLLSEGLPVNRRDGDMCLLQLAIMSNRDDIIDKIMKSGPDFRMKDKNGNTPLMTSIMTGRIDIAKKILECCPETKYDVNNDGSTVLHVAASSGKATTLEWLLGDVKVNVTKDDKDNKGCTALHLAALKGNERMYKILLDKGWKSGILVKSGNAQICVRHFAVLSGNMNFVLRLHDSGKLFHRTPHKNTPSVLELLAECGQLKTLQWLCEVTGVNFDDVSFLAVRNKAILSGNEAMANWLIDRGVDLEKGDKFGETASLLAAQRGNFHILKTIVEKCMIDLSVRSKHEVTLVQKAVCVGHEQMMRYLIKKGAPKDEPDADGDTPLLEAIYINNPKLLMILHKEFRCVIKRENKLQRNAAHLAAIAGSHQILDYLKGYLTEAFFDACDLHRNTPLMLAVLYSQEAAAKFLLENFQLDIDNQNETGSTALHWATLSADKALINLLLDHSAKVDIKDKDGATPLMLAVQEKSVDCVKILLEKGASISTENNNGDSALALMLHSDGVAFREVFRTYAEEDEIPSGPTSGEKLGHLTIKSLHYHDHFPEKSSDEQQSVTESDKEEVDEQAEAQVDDARNIEDNEPSQSEAATASIGRRQAAPSIDRRSAGSTVTSIAQSEMPEEGARAPRITSSEAVQRDRRIIAVDVNRPDQHCQSKLTKSMSELRKLRSAQTSNADAAELLCPIRETNLRLEVTFSQPGQPLRCHLEEIRARDTGTRLLGEADGRTVSKSILSGLSHLHSTGIPHGSLRLDNVRIVDGRFDRLRLSNYGSMARLARLIRQKEERRVPEPWTAPEERQAEAGEPWDAGPGSEKADMWAFGCTLHEVLIGVPPERGAETLSEDYVIKTFVRVQGLDETRANLHETPTLRVRIFPPDLEAAFKDVYKQAPQERKSASDVLTDLNRYQ